MLFLSQPLVMSQFRFDAFVSCLIDHRLVERGHGLSLILFLMAGVFNYLIYLILSSFVETLK